MANRHNTTAPTLVLAFAATSSSSRRCYVCYVQTSRRTILVWIAQQRWSVNAVTETEGIQQKQAFVATIEGSYLECRKPCIYPRATGQGVPAGWPSPMLSRMWPHGLACSLRRKLRSSMLCLLLLMHASLCFAASVLETWHASLSLPSALSPSLPCQAGAEKPHTRALRETAAALHT